MVSHLLHVEESAATVEEAVERALRRWGCSRAEVEVDIVETPGKGLFGLVRSRPARVNVRLTDRAYIARVITLHLLGLCGFSGSVEVNNTGDQIHLQIQSDQSSIIIGRRGQTLDALQSLVNLLTDRHVTDRSPLVLDSDDYRQRRRVSLSRLARRLASQVRRTGKPATVQDLLPEERRYLHTVFSQEADVVTRSVGQGQERKVVVSLTRS